MTSVITGALRVASEAAAYAIWETAKKPQQAHWGAVGPIVRGLLKRNEARSKYPWMTEFLRQTYPLSELTSKETGKPDSTETSGLAGKRSDDTGRVRRSPRAN